MNTQTANTIKIGDVIMPPIASSRHHASCKPSDRDLVWLCSQCGGHESAESLLNNAEKLAEALRDIASAAANPHTVGRTFANRGWSDVTLDSFSARVESVAKAALAQWEKAKP